jgi:tetratricopeptide (TPR) repeat protein
MNVFLSHSTRDKQFAVRLKEAMRQEDFLPWLYESEIEPNANWVARMEDGLRDADLVLLLWSPDAAASAATELEWTSALAREIRERRQRLGVVMLRQCDLPQLLRTKFCIDATRNETQGLDETMQWLRARRAAGRVAGARAPVFIPGYQPRDFVGRADQLELLHAALADTSGVFLLTGEAGSGKSTLAAVFANDAQREFDAVVYQTCGEREPEAIYAELAESLSAQLGDGVRSLPPDRKIQAVNGWLKQRPSLLVLDDVCHPGAMKFRNLLPGPPVSVLFTSRHPRLWLTPKDVTRIESFTTAEAETVFRTYLGEASVKRYRADLLQFAERVQRLPIAVSVGAQLLADKFGPLDEIARGLALNELRNEVHDVPGLLQHAIDARGDHARKLLAAAAACLPEGFWLPLATEIAGLSKKESDSARDELVNASLLRMVDRERQRFQIHALVREQMRPKALELREAHASALEKLFKDYQTRWRECRECLEEILPAAEFLWNAGQKERAASVCDRGAHCGNTIGELETALRILQQEESFWATRQGRDAQDALSRSYGHQAIILEAWGRLDEAMALLKKQEEIGLELGNKDSLQRSYGNQALILQAWGRLDEAVALHKKKEEICLELGNKDSLQISYGNQAIILQAWGRLDEAMALLKKGEEICLELGNKKSLQSSYGNQAIIFSLQKKFTEALDLFRKQEAICIELGIKADLGYCYVNWGILAQDQGDQTLAKEKLQAALAIFTELKMPRQRDDVQANLDALNS